jgi:hypothetical protein
VISNYDAARPPSNATDGRTDAFDWRSSVHTGANRQPFVEVDIGTVLRIRMVKVYKRERERERGREGGREGGKEGGGERAWTELRIRMVECTREREREREREKERERERERAWSRCATEAPVS